VSRLDPIIRASEIGEYIFCARAWWLGRVKGYRSVNLAAMRRGMVEHRRHGRMVEGYHRLRRVAIALLLLAGAVLVAGLLLSIGR
jgi:hypothetical protein